MERTNFHETSYGWNYFFEIAKTGSIRVGRYHTNGWQNKNEHTTRWGVCEKPPNDSAECQRVYHNEKI